MKYLVALAILLTACGLTNSAGPDEVETYNVRYMGTVKGQYSVWFRNPENGDIGRNVGTAPSSGMPWASPHYSAHSGDTLWTAGSAEYGLELMITVDDSVWAIGQFADTTHVELVLP